jgi:membrane protein
MRRAVAGPGEGFTARDWIVVLQRVRKEAKEDNLGLVAAGVAFWAILSIVPLLVGVMAVAAVVTGPGPRHIRSQLGPLATILPEPVARSLTGQLSDAAAAMGGQGQTLGLAIGLLGVLWTCARGIGALISGLHIVIDETETRGVIRRRATAFGLAVGALATVFGALALVSAVPHVALHDVDLVLVFGIRCVLVAAFVVVGLILLYRYGPDRANADWHAVRWGAGIAMTCWLVMSIVLGGYVAGTGGRSSTYGTLAGAAAIATWLYMSSYIVLLGAEINAEIERLLAHRSAFRDAPPEVKPESKPEDELKGQPGDKAEGQPEGKVEDQRGDVVESHPQAKAEARPEGKPEIRPEGKPETQPGTKPNARPDDKPETQAAARPSARPEGQAEQSDAAAPGESSTLPPQESLLPPGEPSQGPRTDPHDEKAVPA